MAEVSEPVPEAALRLLTHRLKSKYCVSPHVIQSLGSHCPPRRNVPTSPCPALLRHIGTHMPAQIHTNTHMHTQAYTGCVGVIAPGDTLVHFSSSSFGQKMTWTLTGGNLHPPMISEAEHLFIYPLTMFMLSLEKCLFNSFAHF